MSLVNRVRPKVRCQVHPCREKAEFAIGPANKRRILYYVCETHLKQILDDGAAVLSNTPTIPEEPSYILGEPESEPCGEEDLRDDESIYEEGENSQEAQIEPQKPETEGDEVAPTPIKHNTTPRRPAKRSPARKNR